jgi:hypothetical protein
VIVNGFPCLWQEKNEGYGRWKAVAGRIRKEARPKERESERVEGQKVSGSRKSVMDPKE